MNWYETIFNYQPTNEQERIDQWLFLDFVGQHDDVLTRGNQFGHLTATAFIVNEDRDKFVAVYHKLQDGWTMPGGHADGETNLWLVAETEVEEETGLIPRPLHNAKPFGLQLLPCPSHTHRSRGYTPAHIHLDVSYLFEASESAELAYRPEESNDIRWLSFDAADSHMVVDFMRPVHRKLIKRLQSEL